MTTRRPRFSGHQTFSFRYGWLEKGYHHIKENRRFTDPDALVRLGVGKNMVESIRYWCDVFGLATDQTVSPFGDALLSPESGWDPYLEDDASLWLLHWKLCSQPFFMNAATLLFGQMHKREFDRQEWLELLLRHDAQNTAKATSLPTLERDIECYLKMYTPLKVPQKKRVLELSYACPFQELGLLSVMEGGNRLRFSLGSKEGLPPEIIGYAIWDYLRPSERSGVRLSELVYGDYGPGQIFMLDENSLVEAVMHLHQSERWKHCFNITASEGIETVHCGLSNGDALLNAYYNAATE